MLTVAYLANEFPSPVEPYVADEIEELRKRGVRVLSGSVKKSTDLAEDACRPDVSLRPLPIRVLLQGTWLCLARWSTIWPFLSRIFLQGHEGPVQRIKALAHTLLGACYAVMLETREVEHIHVHHGYFGAWIGMVAARLLDTDFSMTLHGSDLLLHATYLDVKLANCAFCLTVSEYNRRHILENYPDVAPAKVIVSRLGVDVRAPLPVNPDRGRTRHVILAVGRLHRVKDHNFLVRACADLRANETDFECWIAGEGPERRHLELLIQRNGLNDRVTLLGHVAREQMSSLYNRADVVVLTSRSEGIPLVLMEAMAHGKIVLAPAITGIPELVIPGKTGFLYQPGSRADFVSQALLLRWLMQMKDPDRYQPRLDWIRHAARVHIRNNFNRPKNLEAFATLFLSHIAPRTESVPNENFVLQQI